MNLPSTTKSHQFKLITKARSWALLATTLQLLAQPAPGQSNSAIAYTFATFAGNPSNGDADGVGDAAQFFSLNGVTADSGGDIYVADTGNNTIRKISPAGVVSTLAGFPGISGSTDGYGRNARFSGPSAITVDSGGNLYIADTSNNTIRKATPIGTNWLVTTIAGSTSGFYGSDDGLGSSALLHGPRGIVADISGVLYVADSENSTIRQIAPVGTNWVVTTIAGSAMDSPGSSDGYGNNARFAQPSGLTIGFGGAIYVADSGNDTIREIIRENTNWVVRTIAGSATTVGTNDGLGTNGARFSFPAGIAFAGGDATGLWVTDSGNGTIRKVIPTSTNWLVSTVAGAAGQFGNADGTGSSASFQTLSGIAADDAGFLYVGDVNRIRKVTSAGMVTTLAGDIGSAGSRDGTGTNARFNYPVGIAADTAQNVYVADVYNNTIRRITSAGVVNTLAGSVTAAPGTLDGTGSNARFLGPSGVAVDGVGNVYIAESVAIRKVTPAGVVTTLAGQPGVRGSTDGTGTNALFRGLFGIALDGGGNLYVTDTGSETIRKLTPAGTNWVVSTIAGRVNSAGTNDGTGTNALFCTPLGITADYSGNLYVADYLNFTIRKLALVGTNWFVRTIAGTPGTPGISDGIGSAARFYYPSAVAADSAGNLYVADTRSSRIRKIVQLGTNFAVGTIGGPPGYNGGTDGTPFYQPQGIAVDNLGLVYVADTWNNTIRTGFFTQYTPINPLTYLQPPRNSQLTVTLDPPEANGQWRFPWEFGWRTNGQTASNLVAGNYTVELRTIPGWLPIPPFLTNVVVDANTNVSITSRYYPTLSSVDVNSGGGSLTVSLGINPPSAARWGFLGDGTPSLPSGYTTNLHPGIYVIEFASVANRVRPSSQAVQINAGQPSYVSVSYLLPTASTNGFYLPFPVPSNQISQLTNYPFGFNGQLQSDIGYGSGVAVQTNVVLTAAHLVFNDQSLSYVSNGVYWFFQREAGIFEPQPQAARGWVVLDGYAAQRTNDLQSGYSPDQSTPPSRNLDVAALYFQDLVAGGGYGGYLPSDAVPNTWLASTALKMLVGYPVDGSQFENSSIAPGTMYQTDPQPYPLNIAPDPVPRQQEIYTANWFLGHPGNSGGPLYVQLNGYYYPVAVYLGTLFSGSQPYASMVRAIDSNVVAMITAAQELVNTGTNHTGGGVITVIPAQVSTSNPGYIQFHLAPPAAVLAGAAWKLEGDATYSTATNYTRDVLSTNAFAIQFKPIPGWNLPTNQSVKVTAGQITNFTAFYTVTNPVLVADATVGLGITGTTGTVYRIERRSSLNTGNWLPLSTNTIISNGLNAVLPPPGADQPAAFYRALWLGR